MPFDLSLIADAALDALIDSLKMLPLLYIIYLLIEIMEVKLGDRLGIAVARAGKLGPLVGAVAGIIPQCGVSVMAAALYTQRLLTIGTFAAVFLATSDELIPVILSQPDAIGLLWPMLAAKLVVAILAGYVLDIVFRKHNQAVWEDTPLTAEEELAIQDWEWQAQSPQAAEGASVMDGGLTQAPAEQGTEGAATAISAAASDAVTADVSESAAASSDAAETAYSVSDSLVAAPLGSYACGCGCGCESGAESLSWREMLLYPLGRTLKVFVFIFLVSLVLALAFALVGQEAIAQALEGRTILQPVLAALVGLIPNCAASVAITELYATHVLTFGAALAGLLANGGLGLLVLLEEGNRREALIFAAGMFALSVAAGLVAQALPIMG